MKRVALIGALLLFAAPVMAGPKDADQARTLMKEGDARYASNDFSGALERYRAADAIMNVPSTRIAVAKAEAALGKLVEARDTALSIARIPAPPNEPNAFVRSREEAVDLAKELGERIPSIEIKIGGVVKRVEITVTVDGAEVPRATFSLPRKLNPGPHTVIARAPGYPDARADVTVQERENREIHLMFEASATRVAPQESPSPAPEPARKAETRPNRTLMWAGFGVAGVGIAVGSVTGLVSLSKAKSARDQCNPDDTCPEAARDEIDSSKSFATISNISFGVAVIGAGVGVYGLLSSKKTRETTSNARLTPVIGAGYVGVHTRF